MIEKHANLIDSSACQNIERKERGNTAFYRAKWRSRSIKAPLRKRREERD